MPPINRRTRDASNKNGNNLNSNIEPAWPVSCTVLVAAKRTKEAATIVIKKAHLKTVTISKNGDSRYSSQSTCSVTFGGFVAYLGYALAVEFTCVAFFIFGLECECVLLYCSGFNGSILIDRI